MEQIVNRKKLALSIPEAAELMSISDTAMRQLARTKGFPSFKMGTRLLVSAKGMEEWIEKQCQMDVCKYEEERNV